MAGMRDVPLRDRPETPQKPHTPPGNDAKQRATLSTETLAIGAVAWMVSGAGVSACWGGGASVLVPGSGGDESVSMDLEQVVDGADESPLT